MEEPVDPRSYSTKVRAYYHRRAPEYDDWWLGEGLYAPVPEKWAEERNHLLETLAALEPKRTLDVACGTGFVTMHLPGDVVGIDQSDAMVNMAAKRVQTAEFVVGDAIPLPFEDRSFDRVFTSHFYGHLEEPDRIKFLAEARRVAPELIVVDAATHGGIERNEWQDRVLKDGSQWRVYKRYFSSGTLLSEVGGGETIHSGRWFVAVRSPRASTLPE
jgi:demethylmenaquinone methyltransferase/2-methoxy-6-polyprenyl-1,4-benzoquinol methylase